MKKFRHESKFRINKIDELALSHRLSKLFPRDKNASHSGEYKITSLYFDNLYDQAFFEKADGVNKRAKYRIRYYNDDLNFIRLEKKSKINNLSQKTQVQIKKEEIENIFNKQYDFLLDHKEFHDFYLQLRNNSLKPKSIVIYQREAYAFVPGNVRITLDKNIRTTLNQLEQFLNTKEISFPILPEFSILEVKWDEFLPEIVKLAIRQNSANLEAFSKYAASRLFN
ncbi:MAG: polyphosphate polymerase domain-containing protein [Clostridiaceae bacterium]|nr:polyphosphate polymerase domain-containing protein [Clostridiaceae bacterium]